MAYSIHNLTYYLYPNQVTLDTKTNVLFNVCGSVSGCDNGAAVCSDDASQVPRELIESYREL